MVLKTPQEAYAPNKRGGAENIIRAKTQCPRYGITSLKSQKKSLEHLLRIVDSTWAVTRDFLKAFECHAGVVSGLWGFGFVDVETVHADVRQQPTI